MKKQSFIKGALIISLGGIVAKVLGAFYRIPLTNILGGKGMGVYQMVYPLYCLLLTVSATGIPSGLARIVSHAEAQRGPAGSSAILRRSLALFSAIGLIGSVLMLAVAPAMAAAQGEPLALSAYRMLAPSVFLVSVISCFRGYFQGKSNFLPTALSEIVEQAVKISLGLYFAQIYAGNVGKAVSAALFAVTLSEVAAACFMFLYRFAQGSAGRRPLYAERAQNVRFSSLLRFTLPVTVAAGILPLSNILDSIIIVNLIGRYSDRATALYGLYSGGANTLVNLPVSVCYGLAAAIIPVIASLYAVKKEGEAEQKVAFALKCTLFIAVPSAAFLFAFPTEITRLLFRSVTGQEGVWLVRLVRIMSVTAILLSAVQTLSACLTGRGKPKIAAISMTAAVGVKLALEVVLVRIPRVSIAGAAIASIGCYFVALLVNLLYIIRDKKILARTGLDLVRFSACAAGGVGAAYFLRFAGVFAVAGVTVAVYLALAFLLGCFAPGEIDLFGRRKNVNHRRFGLFPRRFIGGR